MRLCLLRIWKLKNIYIHGKNNKESKKKYKHNLMKLLMKSVKLLNKQLIID